jgi:CRISPR-associated protein Csb2
MPSHFCVSVHFLDLAFHGRGDGGVPEWPPSPLRVFQSLVVAAARRRRTEPFVALQWLEQQPAPVLIAPAGVTASGYRLSVPNNAMDIVAKAWCRGNDSNSGDANPATHRTMKSVRPTLMIDGDAVHYLWPLPDPLSQEVRHHAETLFNVARSVVALGWGVDMAVGHAAIVADEQVDALPGERWLPSTSAIGGGLRVPVQGTFKALTQRHEGFLNRLSDGFTAPPPLTGYTTVTYRRAIDPPSRSVAAFSLLKLDASGFHAFGAARQALTVAGMMRYAAKLAAERTGWQKERIDAFILGHSEKDGAAHVAVGAMRFAYLPLPSIEARGENRPRVAGSVRRAILTVFTENCADEIAWARRALSGQELINKDKKKPVALLSLVPATENVVRQYTQPAAAWATVTPVVLPGYDDPSHYRRRLKYRIEAEEQKRLLERLQDRAENLLRKAITQAGFSQVLADHAEIEWSKVGFWPGTDLADRYGVPDHLKRFPRFHVRIQWRDAQNRPVQVNGPVCLGGGRFFGLGLFAACSRGG